MKYHRWAVRGYDQKTVCLLEETGAGKLASRVLASRGILDAEGLKAFLIQNVSGLNDPFLLKDMDRAVLRIRRAISSGERIAVYGDYDADGASAVCLLMDYLKSCGADCVWYIPDRLKEGYGLNISALKELRDGGASLIITVDTGVCAVSEALFASDIGLDIVITDHHKQEDLLPDACAVVDPCRTDCPYPYKTLAGVGVAFKLVCALAGRQNERHLIDKYSGLVALGTVADVMPVTGENRILVSCGLNRFNESPGIGLSSLIKCAGVSGKRIDAAVLGFALAPRINAAGRMGFAQLSAKLLMADDSDEADALASELCRLNIKRQQVEEEILSQAIELVLKPGGPAEEPVILLSGENWHTGVTGIVCSKLSERFGKPALLVCLDGETGRGSARSVPGFNMFEALKHCGGVLESFGGHESAAGFVIKKENINAFREMLCSFAEGCKTQFEGRKLDIDCEIPLADITVEQAHSLAMLEPFGTGNPQPVFLIKDVPVTDIRPIGGGRHLRFKAGGVGAVYFGMERDRFGYIDGGTADIAARLEINSFRGEQAQLIVCDIRPCEKSRRVRLNGAEIFDAVIFADGLTECKADGLYPARDEFASLWRMLKRYVRDEELDIDEDTLIYAAAGESASPEACARVMVCLEAFRECGLIGFKRDMGRITLRFCDYEGKADLAESRLLGRLKTRF